VAADAPVRAIGRLEPDGPYVGFQLGPHGHQLVFGMPDGSIRPDPTTGPAERNAGLVAGAIAYFLTAVTDPPPEFEATQADMAAVVISLAAELDGEPRRMAQEAVDAIDDGIHADSVALRLQRLLPPGADAVAILRDRLAQLPPR
jgi:hypothetical protein